MTSEQDRREATSRELTNITVQVELPRGAARDMQRMEQLVFADTSPSTIRLVEEPFTFRDPVLVRRFEAPMGAEPSLNESREARELWEIGFMTATLSIALNDEQDDAPPPYEQ